MAEWFKQQAVNLSYIGSNPIPCAIVGFIDLGILKHIKSIVYDNVIS